MGKSACRAKVKPKKSTKKSSAQQVHLTRAMEQLTICRAKTKIPTAADLNTICDTILDVKVTEPAEYIRDKVGKLYKYVTSYNGRKEYTFCYEI